MTARRHTTNTGTGVAACATTASAGTSGSATGQPQEALDLATKEVTACRTPRTPSPTGTSTPTGTDPATGGARPAPTPPVGAGVASQAETLAWLAAVTTGVWLPAPPYRETTADRVLYRAYTAGTAVALAVVVVALILAVVTR
jgi:hypothetical protein